MPLLYGAMNYPVWSKCTRPVIGVQPAYLFCLNKLGTARRFWLETLEVLLIAGSIGCLGVAGQGVLFLLQWTWAGFYHRRRCKAWKHA